MSTKRHKKAKIDVVAARKLLDQLIEFSREFDSSDPEGTEVELKTHISKLVDEGVVKLKKRKIHLREVLGYILKKPETSEIVENAQTFETLISSYGGEPTEDDMQEL